MRVFELAREIGVSSADVVKAAASAGVDASNAISSLDGADADRLRSALVGADKSALAAKRAAKAKTAAELNAEFLHSIALRNLMIGVLKQSLELAMLKQ